MNEEMLEPLAFSESASTGSRAPWSTYEMEGYAIFECFKCIGHLFSCEDTIVMFTDRRNVLFVFHPTALKINLGRQKVLKMV